MSEGLDRLSASQAAQAIASGFITSEQLVQACLDQIREKEPQVQAWQFLDEKHALDQARARDQERAEGRSLGALHGIPIGVKDIIDTDDMPTEDGTSLHAGRTPANDATVVALLRAAGAVIMGKTVTTECANMTPGKTRNPHNLERTPGGSSSGSAAAVAANMVPLAIGTQTSGSIIRPASYCGVYGFKPSHGLISRQGILKLSRSLDTVGFFSRSLEDLALIADQLVGYDERDLDTRPRAPMRFAELVKSEPPLPPTLAFVKTAVWGRAEESTHQAFAELVEELGGRCQTIELPSSLQLAWEQQRIISESEMAFNLDLEWQKGQHALSAGLRQRLESGRATSALSYQHALATVPKLLKEFDEVFASFDALITPASTGTAPGLDSTGDPVFCSLWSLLGMPAVNLPLMTGADQMPLGVQLVGSRLQDARLLRTANWLQNQILQT
ncbi:MAG: amidase [Burkholderiaceae bacterium]